MLVILFLNINTIEEGQDTKVKIQFFLDIRWHTLAFDLCLINYTIPGFRIIRQSSLLPAYSYLKNKMFMPVLCQ